MTKFHKLVVIEPVNLTEEGMECLREYAGEVEIHKTIPENDEEIRQRIGDADAVLISFTSRITGAVLRRCSNLKYVGMCCSLYDPASANVDIVTAGELGITVKGVRDYGDPGVPEYVISELVRLLHGFGKKMWKDVPMELTDIPVGVIGLGVTGKLVAKALKFFGTKVFYYSRTRKPELEEQEGYIFKDLHEVLKECDIICTCLNKNVILLGREEFNIMGNGKILINTSIAPSHEIDAVKQWLLSGDNYLFSDTAAGIGEEELLSMENVFCGGKVAGTSSLSKIRLTEKVLHNMKEVLGD